MIWALHGNLGHPGDWAGLREALSDLELVSPSLWCPGPLPFQAWADQFNREVRSRDSHPVLIGYSLGGRLAMHALKNPGAPWKAVVFVSAHPGLSDPVARELRLEEDRGWADLLKSRPVAEFLERWNAQPALRGEPLTPDQAETVSTHREAISAAFSVWSLGSQADLRPDLALCEVPQLWVAGTLDRKFAPLMEEAAALIPSASYAEIGESGHRVPLRNPLGLAECVRRFLAAT